MILICIYLGGVILCMSFLHSSSMLCEKLIPSSARSHKEMKYKIGPKGNLKKQKEENIISVIFQSLNWNDTEHMTKTFNFLVKVLTIL